MTENPAQNSGFDPRFNPAFQPGFDPERDGEQATKSAQRKSVPVSPPPVGDRSIDTPRERLLPPTRTTAATPGQPARSGQSARRAVPEQLPSPFVARDEPVRPVLLNAADGAPLDNAIPEPATATRRMPPLLVSLWVLSAAFVAAGVAVPRILGARLDSLSSTAASSTIEYFELQAYASIGPLLIVLGLATATGTLFLLAARRRS